MILSGWSFVLLIFLFTVILECQSFHPRHPRPWNERPGRPGSRLERPGIPIRWDGRPRRPGRPLGLRRGGGMGRPGGMGPRPVLPDSYYRYPAPSGGGNKNINSLVSNQQISKFEDIGGDVLLGQGTGKGATANSPQESPKGSLGPVGPVDPGGPTQGLRPLQLAGPRRPGGADRYLPPRRYQSSNVNNIVSNQQISKFEDIGGDVVVGQGTGGSGLADSGLGGQPLGGASPNGDSSSNVKSNVQVNYAKDVLGNVLSNQDGTASQVGGTGIGGGVGGGLEISPSIV